MGFCKQNHFPLQFPGRQVRLSGSDKLKYFFLMVIYTDPGINQIKSVNKKFKAEYSRKECAQD